MQQRKELIARPTAMAQALVAAALAHLEDPDNQLPEAIRSWRPSRAVKREPTWTVSRRSK